jgi:hypothetical protein
MTCLRSLAISCMCVHGIIKHPELFNLTVCSYLSYPLSPACTHAFISRCVVFRQSAVLHILGMSAHPQITAAVVKRISVNVIYTSGIATFQSHNYPPELDSSLLPMTLAHPFSYGANDVIALAILVPAPPPRRVFTVHDEINSVNQEFNPVLDCHLNVFWFRRGHYRPPVTIGVRRVLQAPDPFILLDSISIRKTIPAAAVSSQLQNFSVGCAPAMSMALGLASPATPGLDHPPGWNHERGRDRADHSCHDGAGSARGSWWTIPTGREGGESESPRWGSGWGRTKPGCQLTTTYMDAGTRASANNE